MNIWEILGIPPTTDLVRIKKAYADRAKTWHPEEYPEEFKRLRYAYQEALRQAKSGTAVGVGKTEEAPRRENGGSAATGKREAAAEPETAERAEAEAAEESKAAAEPETAERAEAERAEESKAAAEPETAERAEAEAAEESKAAAEPEMMKSAETAAEPEQGEPQPQFSYDDVSSFYRKDLEKQFFEEFHRIVWNPYLQNVKAVWSYFLFRPAYDDLYCHEDFQLRLVQEICAVSGWHGETLDYFEYWYELYREPKRKDRKSRRMKSVSAKWRRKKWRSKFTFFMPVSREMRGEHYAILQIIKDRGLDGSLLNGISVQAYLKYYDGFIRDHEKWPENQRSIGSKKRIRYWIYGTLLLLLSTILILTLAVRKVTDTAREKQRLEQKKQEEELLQESREQEEWQRELEERFQNMQEQHRDWTEQ